MRLPALKFLVAGSLIIGGICYLMFSGINNALVYYYTLTELETQAADLKGRGVRVSGHVQTGSIVRGANSSVDFVVLERDTGKTLSVHYKGIIPDTFKDEAEVVVAGLFDTGAHPFQADTLLAKCPSKYEELGDKHPEEVTRPQVSSLQ